MIDQFIAIAAVARAECRANPTGGQAEQLTVGDQVQVTRFGVGIGGRRGTGRAAGDGGALIGHIAPAEPRIQARLPLTRKVQCQAGEQVELARVREQPGFVGRAGNGGVHLALGERAGHVQGQHIAELLHAVHVQAVALRTGVEVVRLDPHVLREILVHRRQVALLQELVAGQHMATIPRPACRLRGLVFLHAAGGHGAVTHSGLIPGEVAAQDDVDHTADRIGAIDGRGTIGEDLHAFHRTQRYQRDIHVLVAVRRGHAMAVDQGQRGAGSQTAQVDGGALAEVVAGIAVDAKVGDVGTIGATAEVLRQFLEQLLHGGHAGAVDGLLVDHDDRRGASANGIADVAADHQHLVQGGGRRLGRCACGPRTPGIAGVLGDRRHAGQQCSGNAEGHERAWHGSGYVRHSPVHRSHPKVACDVATPLLNGDVIAYHYGVESTPEPGR